ILGRETGDGGARRPGVPQIRRVPVYPLPSPGCSDYDSVKHLMSSSKFEYRGDLSEMPLPEILATILRYRVPGIVSVSRDGRARRIYVDDGLVLFAASNERDLGLTAFLLTRGLLDAETAREAEERRA